MSNISFPCRGKRGWLKCVAQRIKMDPQEMYRNLVEMAHEGITMVDPDDNITFVNGQFAKSLGFQVNELIGRSLFDLATKESALQIAKEMEKRKAGLKSRYEVTLIHRNGSKKHFWLSASPMFSSSKEFIGSIGVYADVTEKKVIEGRLERKNKQINTLYRVYGHARMAKFLSDVFNGIVEELVHAFPDSEIAQARILFDRKMYSHPKKIDHLFCALKAPLVIDGVRRGFIEVGYSGKSNLNRATDLLKEERELLRMVAKILCKHMAAREVLARYKDLVRKSFTAIIVVRDDKIVFANPRFYRMFRCKEGQVLSHRAQDFFPNCNLKRCAESRLKESTGLRANGKFFDLDLITQRISFAGQPAMLVRIYDTSALKKAQRKLASFNSELRKTVKDKTLHLEEANRRLRTLNQTKDEFIAVTSHELRSPLTSIRGYLSFLIEEESLSQMAEPYREYLIRAYSTTDALNYLINNILDVSRLDMGRFELQKQKVDVVKLIQSIVDSLSFQANEARLQFQFVNDTGQAVVTCQMDPIRVSQALRNILDNAIKFTKKGKRITILLKRDSGWVTIAVADQGVGIPKSKLNRVFDKFVQVRSTQTRFKGGVGLGLFISKKIVELHNGRICAEQNKDGGVTISIQLPRN